MNQNIIFENLRLSLIKNWSRSGLQNVKCEKDFHFMHCNNLEALLINIQFSFCFRYKILKFYQKAKRKNLSNIKALLMMCTTDASTKLKKIFSLLYLFKKRISFQLSKHQRATKKNWILLCSMLEYFHWECQERKIKVSLQKVFLNRQKSNFLNTCLGLVSRITTVKEREKDFLYET